MISSGYKPRSTYDEMSRINTVAKAAKIFERVASYKLKLNKRRKIIIASFITTFGLVLSTQTVYFLFLNYRLLLILGVVVYLVSLWALWEGLTRSKAIILLILPVLYTIAVANFYFLLPVRWLTRVPVAIAFGLSFYLLLLSQNVFNVSAIRTIPLYRAASTTKFLFTIITSVMLFQVLHALSLPFYLNGSFAALISFLLTLPVLWSIDMDKVTTKIWVFSSIISLIVGEFALVLSFWPIPANSLMWAISLSSVLFILLGCALDLFKDRLKSREVVSWLGFGVLVYIVIFLTTNWTG